MSPRNPFKSPRDWRVVAAATAASALGVTTVAAAWPSQEPAPVESIALTDQRSIADQATERPLAITRATPAAAEDLDSPFDDDAATAASASVQSVDQQSVQTASVPSADSPDQPSVQSTDTPDQPSVQSVDSPDQPDQPSVQSVDSPDQPDQPSVQSVDSPDDPSVDSASVDSPDDGSVDS